MIVGHADKYVFISTPKVGTNSLYTYLETHCNGFRWGGFHETRDIFPRNYFRFSTCRNPYDKALSAWWSTCMRGEMRETDRYEFRKGCESKGLNSDLMSDWMRYIMNYPHNHAHISMPQHEWHRQFHLDRVFRLEYLQEELDGLYFTNFEEVSKQNSTPDSKREYLTKDAIQLINEYYEGDFRIYDYEVMQ